MLVTFATIGSRPIQSSAGKETSVPPPATALIIPATKAASRMTKESKDTRTTYRTLADRQREARLLKLGDLRPSACAR